LDGEPAGACDALQPRLDRDIGIAKGEAFEVDVVAAHHVEERVIAGAIEDRLPVAGRLDHDRLVGGAAGGQIVGPVPGRSAAAASGWAAGAVDLPGTASVILPHLAIDSGMDQNR